MMNIKNPSHPADASGYDTSTLRDEFLIEEIFTPDALGLTYSHFDRIIFGGAMPVSHPLKLEAGSELRCKYFLERREMGVINIGGKGIVTVDGVDYEMESKDGLYLGMGTKDIVFSSCSKEEPAKFYINSCPAHAKYPTRKIGLADAVSVDLGTKEDCNERTIHKYILPGNVESCQLVMGMTILKPGSVWNTMPCHTHERRMEVYLYFNVAPDAFVVHLMGEPTETRHIIVRNEQAVISPSWSIHSGVGTRNYTFIWGMCGENQDFDDMDGVKSTEIR